MKRLLCFLLFSIPIYASAVSSITCSGQTATVNSTAHGLSASQGFSLSGTAATFNSTITSATTNAFTFVLPTGTACSGLTSGYTSVQAAKQIIKTLSTAYPLPGTVILNYIMWFTTSLPNPLTCTTASGVTTCPQSQWPNASAAENAAIVAGTTVEFIGQLSLPANTTATGAQTAVEAQYNTMQVAFANFLMAGNGFWWQGTAWVNQ
jgi:hypothetical protein